MTANVKKGSSVGSQDAVIKTGNPPYPFRTTFAIILLLGNFLVAAIYFHLINP